MAGALDLLRIVLDEPGLDDGAARDLLDGALQRETDPLLYLNLFHGLPLPLAMQRAAHWLACAYYAEVPLHLHADQIRLDALNDLRVLPITVLDRRIAFSAPDFFGLLKLHKRLAENPDLRRRLVIVPPQALEQHASRCMSDRLLEEATGRLVRVWPFASAKLDLGRPARITFVALVCTLVALIMLAPHVAQSWLWPVSFFLVAPAALRLAAIGTGARPQAHQPRPDDGDLPLYSVLVPLRNEAQMVPQLFDHLARLDYPADRLDIKFVVESASAETVAAVQTRLGDMRFSLVVVPPGLPQTKPKALDYALPLCRGRYLVVFDAEDRPSPDQLWKAAARFMADPDLVCLQAQLVISNGHRHPLAALFAGEYAGLFGVLLPALARWRLPLPLGGTSNHFDLAVLRELGGWDAFNVTEDADLGARLARRRLKVDVLDSHTLEQAPTRLRAWLGQRRRWMKGWMQTMIVHNRRPIILFRQMGWRAALVFEVLCLGMITAPLLHCSLAVATVLHLALGHPLVDGSAAGVAYIAILAIGYGTTLLLTVQGLLRLSRHKLLLQQVFLPIYWLLIAYATLRAMAELLKAPFFWFKSPHEPERPVRKGGWRLWARKPRKQRLRSRMVN